MLKVIRKNKFLTVVILIYLGLFVFAPSKAVLSIKNSMYYVTEMLQIMPVIFMLTIVIEAWVPKDTIIKEFGVDSGIKGGIYSLLLGSLSAGPIYAAFPICKTFLKKGASIKNIIIILSSWAVIKVPMLANEAKFLGPRFMLIRWILTVISIFVMANIISLFVKQKDIPLESEAANWIDVNKKYCLGCGLCKKIAPYYFEVVDKKARIRSLEHNKEEEKKLREAAEKCPTKAIKVDI